MRGMVVKGGMSQKGAARNSSRWSVVSFSSDSNSLRDLRIQTSTVDWPMSWNWIVWRDSGERGRRCVDSCLGHWLRPLSELWPSGGVPNPGTGNPLGLVHSGAGMGQPPDVLHRQDEVLGRLEQLDRFIVQDVEKALSVHLQNLVPNLPRPPNNTVTWAARRTPTHARGFRALMPACRGGY